MQQLGIFYIHLNLKAYKIQSVQELKLADLPNHYNFSAWAFEKLEEDPLFSTKILFSDKTHFYLHGFVNKIVIFGLKSNLQKFKSHITSKNNNGLVWFRDWWNH